MPIPLRVTLAAALLFIAVPNRPAQAQRGQLIEGLFRSLAEQQMQREQQKRLEAEKRAKMQQAEAAKRKQQPKKDPYEVKLPSGFGTKPAPRVTDARRPADPRNLSINVRSREAADYAGNLVKFNQQVAPLIGELRQEAARHPQVRALLPEAYGVAADTRALLESCDGISSLAPVVDPYSALDARWRQLSFGLKSIPDLSSKCMSAIETCDTLCSSMCNQLDLQPQFDRIALRDVMMTASAYMLALSDDLHIAVPADAHCRKLVHDLRLLRQRLIAEAETVDRISYDNMVANFSEFGNQWRAFSNEVYAINNRHLHRRLDRIGECGEQTYHLLWMQPPISAKDLAATAHRLEHNLEAILSQLNFRAIVQLKPQDQVKVLQTCRDLYDHAGSLHEMCEDNAGRDKLREQFITIDRGWGSLSDTLPQIASLNRGTIAEIDRACEQLRGGFRLENTYAPANSMEQLVQAAAALEGTAEYLDVQTKRYERNLQPRAFRESIRGACDELLYHSQELHTLLDARGRFNDQRYMSRLKGEAEHAVKAWNELAKEFDHIETHGLSESQANRLRQARNQAVPHVAEIAAALLQ